MAKSSEKTIIKTDSVPAKPARRKKPEYSGSRWAGLILLIITFIISLFFYARGGLDPARYSIQK